MKYSKDLNILFIKANKYEIFYGKNIQDIREGCINSCAEVTNDKILEGNVTNPKESGETEFFKIDFRSLNLDDKELLYVGLRSQNIGGTRGDISNVVDCRYIPAAAPPVDVNPPNNGSKKLSGGAIAGIVIGCVAVVGVVAGVLTAFKMQKKKKSVSSINSREKSSKEQEIYENA